MDTGESLVASWLRGHVITFKGKKQNVGLKLLSIAFFPSCSLHDADDLELIARYDEHDHRNDEEGNNSDDITSRILFIQI
jgi:hypothetical protein